MPSRKRWLIHEATLHGVGGKAKQLEDALGALGIAAAKSIDFRTAQVAVETFFKEYERQTKIGENAAKDFAEANKTQIIAWMKSYEDAGKAIPAGLLEIAKHYDILTPKMKALKDNTEAQAKAQERATKMDEERVKSLSSLYEKFLDLDKAYRNDSVEIETHRARSIKAAGEEADAARRSASDQIAALNERNVRTARGGQ